MFTSKVTVPVGDAGLRNVTEETPPLPDIIQSALGLSCENESILEAMSWSWHSKQLCILNNS